MVLVCFVVCEVVFFFFNFGMMKFNNDEMICLGCFEVMFVMVFVVVFRIATSVYNVVVNVVLVVLIIFFFKVLCIMGFKILNNCNVLMSDCSVVVGVFLGGVCVIGFIMSVFNALSWLKMFVSKSEVVE